MTTKTKADKVATEDYVDAAVSGVDLSALLDALIGADPGTMAYRGASGWVAVAVGAIGDQLKLVDDGEGNPIPDWVTP